MQGLNNKTIEGVEQFDNRVKIFFTDGTNVVIASMTTIRVEMFEPLMYISPSSILLEAFRL
jgi:uncharacterized protein (DUF427 family)